MGQRMGLSGYSGGVRVGRMVSGSVGGHGSTGMEGGSACEASVWVSDSGVGCKSAGGVGPRSGAGLPVVVSAGLQGGSVTRAWSYDGPVVSGVGLTNGPSTGCSSLSVVGQRMGLSGYSGGVRVGRMVSGSLGGHGSTGMEGGSACEASVWVSDSGVGCKSGGGVGPHWGAGLPLVVSAGWQGGSLTRAWSYDRAVVSSVALTNGPTTGCASLTA